MPRVLQPKWWALHVTVLVAVLVMLRLGLWKWHRASSPSGGIQNYAYAFQWPLFAVFAVVLWVKTLIEEARRDPNAPPHEQPAAQRVQAEIVRQPGFVIGVSAPAPTVHAEDDPDVAAWNARLAALNAADAATRTRRR